ncbi:UNVERIFIED_CONTAM: Costars family protein ST45-2 [Sesamum angustifolium]|uniref:Costars family protein ST45-2 n=1 Tax=Sesamum angustifolium TaxID=2727405 RepID=A0AAW2QBK9_9LAMI
MNVGEEVDRLKEEIKRLGQPQDDGSYKFLDPRLRASSGNYVSNPYFVKTGNKTASVEVWKAASDDNGNIIHLMEIPSISQIHSKGFKHYIWLLLYESSLIIAAHYTVDKTYPSLSSDGILSWDLSQFVQVTFGVLFNDDRCANIFEALVGTLRAAKKRKVVAYDGELLLQGVHDNVEITLKPEATASDAVVSS